MGLHDFLSLNNLLSKGHLPTFVSRGIMPCSNLPLPDTPQVLNVIYERRGTEYIERRDPRFFHGHVAQMQRYEGVRRNEQHGNKAVWPAPP